MFDVKNKEAMMSWVEAISKYAGVREDNSLRYIITFINVITFDGVYLYSSAAPITGRTESYEMALNGTRSPEPVNGHGRNHLTEFTPLALPQEIIPEETLVPGVRTQRSNSVGNIEMPRSAPLVRRVSDAAANGITAEPLPRQRTFTPPLTESHDHQTVTSIVISPESTIANVLSTDHSTSLRSLNTSFIDGPPAGDSAVSKANCSSNNNSPRGTPSRGSPILGNSPIHGNSPVHGNSPLPSQQERMLSDIDNLQVDLGLDADRLRQYPWFHGMISRMDAALLVTQNGDNGTGEFLIRQSESRAGDLVLSFNYHGRAKVTNPDSILHIKFIILIIAHSI